MDIPADDFHLTWKDIARLNNHDTVFDAADYVPLKWDLIKRSDGDYVINWDTLRLKLREDHPNRAGGAVLPREVKLELLDMNVHRLNKARKFLKKLFRDLEGVDELDELWDKYPEQIDAYDDAIHRAQRRLADVVNVYRIAYNQLVDSG